MTYKERPAFVIGAMRSGTTLLRYLLNSHQRLACPPETKLLVAISHILDFPQVLPALYSLDLSREQILKHFRTLFEGVLAEYTWAAGKKRWIDKTPSHVALLPLLDRIFEREPQYVFIVRHPLDCICSLTDFAARFPTFPSEDPDIQRLVAQYGSGSKAWARYWVEACEAIREFSRDISDRGHVIHYEELVACPEETLVRLIRFLEEEPSLLQLHQAFDFINPRGYQDDKILKTRTVHQDSVGTSSRLDVSESQVLWSLVENTAVKFGYGFTNALRDREQGL